MQNYETHLQASWCEPHIYNASEITKKILRINFEHSQLLYFQYLNDI